MHAMNWGRCLVGATVILLGLGWLASDGPSPARSWQTAARYQLHDRTTRFFDRASQPAPTTVTRQAVQPDKPAQVKASSEKS